MVCGSSQGKKIGWKLKKKYPSCNHLRLYKISSKNPKNRHNRNSKKRKKKKRTPVYQHHPMHTFHFQKLVPHLGSHWVLQQKMWCCQETPQASRAGLSVKKHMRAFHLNSIQGSETSDLSHLIWKQLMLM